MSIPKVSAVRPYLLAGGIVVLMIAAKVVFAGLGVGTFNITAWEIALLVVVGAALILFGWQRKTGPDTNLEDGVTEDINTEDEP